jgi:hypothetical protein
MDQRRIVSRRPPKATSRGPTTYAEFEQLLREHYKRPTEEQRRLYGLQLRTFLKMVCGGAKYAEVKQWLEMFAVPLGLPLEAVEEANTQEFFLLVSTVYPIVNSKTKYDRHPVFVQHLRIAHTLSPPFRAAVHDMCVFIHRQTAEVRVAYKQMLSLLYGWDGLYMALLGMLAF